MSEKKYNLLDLLSVLFNHKKLIIIITALSAVFILVFSIISLKLPSEKSPLPNKYTSQAVMVISENTGTSSSTLSSLSNSTLGTIASLTGTSFGASNSALAKYLVTSNIILDKLAKEYDFVAKYEIEKSPVSSCRNILRKNLSAYYDEDSGVFTVSYTDIDPAFAKNIVNSTVGYLDEIFNDIGLDENKRNKENLEVNIDKAYNQINDLQKQLNSLSKSVNYYSPYDKGNTVVQDVDFLKLEIQVQQQIYTQLKTQYEMLKVNMESQRPVFQVLEYASVPDMKSGPSRGKLCIVVVFGAFVFSVFLAFVLDSLKKIKNNPEQMNKLKVVK